jgi:DNA-binding IclR family transcriptional regulator
VLLAFSRADRRASILADLHLNATDADTLARRIHSAQHDGFARNTDARQPGILDLAFPVLDADGAAAAALTVPYVATTYSAVDADTVIDAMRVAAAEIGPNTSVVE